MSTRCQIGFYEKPGQPLKKPSALIYRHSDGYPEGVLPEILPFCVRFDKHRGMGDTEYLAARLLGHLLNDHDGFTRDHCPPQLAGIFAFTGYGISDAFHGDLEYYYAIYGSGLSRSTRSATTQKKDWAIRFHKLGELDIKAIPDEKAAGDYLSYYQKAESGSA